MTPEQACAEWVGILRAVAAGELSPQEALVRRPGVPVGHSDRVPSAFWSARDLLEQHAEFGAPELAEAKAHFTQVMTKLADRIERHLHTEL